MLAAITVASLAFMPTVQQPAGGGELQMVDANTWIDHTAFVPVHLLMHLVMDQDGKQKESLYVTTRQVMRISWSEF